MEALEKLKAGMRFNEAAAQSSEDKAGLGAMCWMPEGPWGCHLKKQHLPCL